MAESLWVIPFGKYRDQDIENVPTDYLEFLLGESWFERKFADKVSVVKQEIKYRNDFSNDKEETDKNWNRR